MAAALDGALQVAAGQHAQRCGQSADGWVGVSVLGVGGDFSAAAQCRGVEVKAVGAAVEAQRAVCRDQRGQPAGTSGGSQQVPAGAASAAAQPAAEGDLPVAPRASPDLKVPPRGWGYMTEVSSMLAWQTFVPGVGARRRALVRQTFVLGVRQARRRAGLSSALPPLPPRRQPICPHPHTLSAFRSFSPL